MITPCLLTDKPVNNLQCFKRNVSVNHAIVVFDWVNIEMYYHPFVVFQNNVSNEHNFRDSIMQMVFYRASKPYFC